MTSASRKSALSFDRAPGILIHITSLPGPYGIGELGPSSLGPFLDFMEEAGQRYWQFLPVGPTNQVHGHSPYMSSSAFAGNPLIVSTELLIEEGLLGPGDMTDLPGFSEYQVLFGPVAEFKEKVLKKAFRHFRQTKAPEGFHEFCEGSYWLKDYALFQALREKFHQRPWYQWPREIASRVPEAISRIRAGLEEEVLFHMFVQYLFQVHWDRFRAEAKKRGIRLIGDIPIYVGLDSADVWANQECFHINPKTLRPACVAGVPPDYFSETGQLWGNPLYRWRVKGKTNEVLYTWWHRRFKRLSDLVDVVRIDHFRGFEAYWRVPAGEKTAVRGRWVKGPGRAFFTRMAGALDGLDIIAEDLGVITPEVEDLRDSLGLPGMKVLQFAFDSDEKNPYLPHNFKTTNCVVYTGTHDNDTTLGWYMDPGVSPESKEKARRYAHSDGSRIHWDFIRMAYSSVAALAMIPMQDILGFGSDCRMNRPGTSKGNWTWRLSPRFLSLDTARALRDEARFYARVPRNLSRGHEAQADGPG